MTSQSVATAAYLVAALLFILSLAGLSKHESSRQGVLYGIILLLIAVAIGAVIGLWRARIVEMTGMPELIALLHSFVGLAAVLVGWNGYLHVEGDHGGGEALQLGAEGMLGIHSAEVVIGVFIGAVTFTGSI